MRAVLRRLRPLLPALLLSASAAAQIEHGGEPPSAYRALEGAVPTVTLPPVDVPALLAEDEARGGKGPFRFGAEVPVDLGFEAGTWTALPDGDRVWRLRITSAGAYSLSFVFSEWDLPIGAELYAYDDEQEWVLGQFNANNNKPNGQMAIRPIAGDAVTLEYFVPRYVESAGALRVGTVVHDYRDVIDILGSDAGADGNCEVDVACPAGAGWEQQVRAVTRLLIGGILCSGSLLNNTANDGTQLYMSANHCGSMSNAIFQFKYEKSGCGSGGASTSFSVQGSTQLAASSAFDFRLARIIPAIPASYEPFFAGWDRSGAFPASTTTIHHPGGDPKKISFDDHPPQKSGSQWRIVQWDLGVTEGGSSGCPLYTDEGLFIGQLCCGAAFCGFPFDDFYGRMDAQWSLIAPHLDPLGTGQTKLAGLDPFAAPPVLTGIAPTTVGAFAPGQVTLTGSDFTGVTAVHVGATTLTAPAFTIVDDATITFNAPKPTGLGAEPVSVEKPVGASGSLDLSYVATDPPKMTATGVTVTGLVAAFNFGAQPNDLWFLFVSIDDPTTTPIAPGIDFLANGLFLSSGSLDGAGLGDLGVLVPSGAAGVTVYGQLALLDGGDLSLAGVSNVTSTLILL